MANSLTKSYDPKLKKLTVRGATTFPREVFDLADQIEILDMSFGELTSLPDDLGRLKHMRVAFFSYHNFEEVPEALATCPSLIMLGMKSCKIKQWSEQALPAHIQGITLTDNQLVSVPAAVGRMTELKKIVATGNQLQDLPRELLQCSQLELLRLGANQFTASPDWLFALPNLAWYTESGNPFCSALTARQLALKTMSWHDLVIGEQIGASAKNTVFRAQDKKSGQAVAVKIYGDKVTTDGYTADEIRTNVAAGTHPNLINAMAQLTDVPEQKLGLVLSLVPPHFQDVGHPPDFKTLTRDIFPGKRFSLPFVVKVLQDVCAALIHLHARGIMHGDVYAHNLLADKTGQTYLGDFGAATLYETVDQRREQLEVRSFGCLIDDLLRHSVGSLYDKPRQSLDALRQDCLQSSPQKRPLFTQIAQRLQDL